MIELKFFTDGEKVYLNNDKGITREVDLSALTGGGGLPDFSGSDAGKYVTPKSDGSLEWKNLPSGGLNIVGFMFAQPSEAVTISALSATNVDLTDLTYYSDYDLYEPLQNAPDYDVPLLITFSAEASGFRAIASNVKAPYDTEPAQIKIFNPDTENGVTLGVYDVWVKFALIKM